MSNSTSDSYFIQARAALLRLCLGCVLCSLFFEMHAAHAAQPVADPFVPGIDLISFKFTHSNIERQPERQPVYTERQTTNRFSARVGFFNSADNSPERVRFGGTSSLPDYISIEKVAAWAASIRWHMTADGNRASLSPQLRVESKETLIQIKPVDRSIWMMWHRTLD